MFFPKRSDLRSVAGYTPAKLITGKRWYVEFYCLNPDTGKLHRKRSSVPPMKSKTERRRYAADVVLAINEKLSAGWNPFFQLDNPKEYAQFADICEEYCAYIRKLQESGLLRPKSYNGYISYMHGLLSWNAQREKPVAYVYQFNQGVIRDFLQYVWIGEGRSARTRDNYLMWIRTFVAWLRENGYAQEDPTVAIQMLVGHRKSEKNRTVIPREEMLRIRAWLEEHNRHYLLACYVIYYCLIRPKEMSHIRLRDISVKNGTIFICGQWSKNKKDQIVTLPDVVLRLMLDLNVFDCDSENYLFSRDFKPGPEYRAGKCFGDFWVYHLKKALHLPDQYKFYSLKDTGITDLIRDNADLLSVRDQARHSSLQMTDLYTPLSSQKANEEIRHRESYF